MLKGKDDISQVLVKALFLLAALPSVALGQTLDKSAQAHASFKPGIGQRFYIDLDSAEGAYSEWRHDDLSGLCALRASLRVLRLRQDTKSLPGFTIWLQEGPVGAKTRRLGIQFWAKQSKPPLQIRIIEDDGPRLVGVHDLTATVGLDVDVSVDVFWLPKSVIVKIGANETHTFSRQWEIKHLAITAATGELKVDPLVLGCVQK
jgi:hypothetical protein